MVPGFSQTTRALRADRGPARVLVAVFMVLLLAWGAWMGLGTVTLYETSALARVRADGVARLRVPVGGRVVQQPVRLGDQVAAGDLLVALDTTEADLAVAVAQAELAALEAHAAARAQERGATGASRAAAVQAQAADRAAARAALVEAEVQRDAARRTLAEAERLQASGAVSAAEVASARSEVGALDARVAAMQARVRQSSGELSEVAEAGSAAAVREQQDDDSLAAELAVARAGVRQAQEARDRHRVRPSPERWASCRSWWRARLSRRARWRPSWCRTPSWWSRPASSRSERRAGCWQGKRHGYGLWARREWGRAPRWCVRWAPSPAWMASCRWCWASQPTGAVCTTVSWRRWRSRWSRWHRHRC